MPGKVQLAVKILRKKQYLPFINCSNCWFSVLQFIMGLQDLQKSWLYPVHTYRWSLKNINQNTGKICMQIYQETEVCKVDNNNIKVMSTVSSRDVGTGGPEGQWPPPLFLANNASAHLKPKMGVVMCLF